MVDGSRYTDRVRRYYQDSRPEATSQLGSPTQAEDFFRSLAEEIETEVQAAAETIAGPDLAGETYLGKVGRFNAARAQAEEMVLGDLLYANPPEQQDEEEGFSPEAKARFLEGRTARAEIAEIDARIDAEPTYPAPTSPQEPRTGG